MAEERLKALRESVLYERRLIRLIFRLAVPLMISTSISAVYEVVDTFWLSRLGPAALSTPTVSWPYRGLLMSIVFGVTASASSLVGQYVGAKNFRMAARAVGSVLGVLLLILIPGSIAFIILERYYIILTKLPPDIRPLAFDYILVLLLVTPLSGINMTFFTSIGATGDTKTPMKVSLMATIINFVLDPLFIFVLGLGVLGAALATAGSIVANATYAIVSFSTRKHGIKVRLKDLIPDKSLLPLIFRISTPMVAQQLGTSLGFVTMIRIVSGLGTPIVAAYSIGQVVLSFDRILTMPISRATSIILSQALGAGLRDRAITVMRKGLGLLMVAAGGYVGLILAVAGPFISVFTRDPLTFVASEKMLVIFGPSIIFFAIYMLANSIARGSGHTLFMAIIGLARLWLLRIPFSWLLAYILGLGDVGLWIGMALSNYVVGVLGFIWSLRGSWARAVIK
jgi:putative MATE family efflux protein